MTDERKPQIKNASEVTGIWDRGGNMEDRQRMDALKQLGYTHQPVPELTMLSLDDKEVKLALRFWRQDFSENAERNFAKRLLQAQLTHDQDTLIKPSLDREETILDRLEIMPGCNDTHGFMGTSD